MIFIHVFIAILVAYFFRKQALKNFKDENMFAVIGGVVYYVGSLIAAKLIFLVLVQILGIDAIYEIPYLFLVLKVLIGLGIAYALYQYLEKKHGTEDGELDIMD